MTQISVEMPNSYTKHETLLSIKDVGLSFGSKIILAGVNAEIQNIERPDVAQGQIVCFLGPSGIGKTQLARCIAGLQQPTSGFIGIGPSSSPSCAGLVGFVQQNYPLFPYLTVAQNLALAGNLGKMGKDAALQKMKQYWDALNLPSSISNSYPLQLSGGQRQRVAIIRQLLCSEHFLILDEPFSGLDIVAKQAACRLISNVAQMDTLNTIIIITHDVTEGMSIADTVWLMGLTASKPGARIVRTYDLAEAGLAWQPDIMDNKQFQEMVVEVKHTFMDVAP